jgi:hypothetical protein
MPTIDIDLANDACMESPISWFNLSNSPFENNSPKYLYSPLFGVEALSPPNVTETTCSPRLWENPPNPSKTCYINLLRDCYLHELFSNLETRTRTAAIIIKDKTSTKVSIYDIENIVYNIVDNEILCSNLEDRHIIEIRDRMTKIMIQSLSSSAPAEEVESTE